MFFSLRTIPIRLGDKICVLLNAVAPFTAPCAVWLCGFSSGNKIGAFDKAVIHGQDMVAFLSVEANEYVSN